MADVQVSIGADITPFRAAMAQAKQQAVETGQAIGINLGDRQGFREEFRMQRGIEGFTRALTSSADPLQAFSMGLESLSRAFRVTGALVLGLR